MSSLLSLSSLLTVPSWFLGYLVLALLLNGLGLLLLTACERERARQDRQASR